MSNQPQASTFASSIGLPASGLIHLIGFLKVGCNNNLTFSNTYQKLIVEVENLFKRNLKKIINNEYKFIKPQFKGSYHKKKDLPKNLKNWDIVIKKYLKN